MSTSITAVSAIYCIYAQSKATYHANYGENVCFHVTGASHLHGDGTGGVSMLL